MKNILLFAFLTAIISCQNKTETQESKPSISLENTVWVNENYLESLKKTKSAQQSKAFADTAMITFNAKADTAVISWNFHESSSYKVVKNEKIQFFDTYQPKQKPDFELSFDSAKLKIGNSFFVKIESEKVAESMLLAGKYQSGETEFELTKDGKVIGIDSLESYTVWTDYVTMNTELDGMDFSSKKGNVSFYGYQFEGKDLVLYEFEWKDEIEGKKGKEIFRFQKK